MRGLALSFAILAAAALLSMPASALAQAGSTGGSIGKQGKSASGGEEQATPRAAPGRKSRINDPASPEESPHESKSPCGRIVGTWRWFNNVDVVFRSDGTGEATNGDRSTWTCSGGMFSVTWRSFGQTDRLTLSPDGKQLSGNSSMMGIAVSGTRK